MSARPPNRRTGAEDPLLYYETRKSRSCGCCCICSTITFVTIFILLLIAFLLAFVGFPFIFKDSPALQREAIFPTSDLLPLDPEFSNFKKYNISGARNIYVTVNKESRLSLGIWHLLPHALVNESLQNEKFDYSDSLIDADYPVVIYFHGNAGNRIRSKEMYDVLRKFFHVIAFDYRGYGDSSPVLPSEDGMVEDALELYRWLRIQTSADIYFWGHDIGSAISTMTTAQLRDDDIMLTGLFLEAPITNARDFVQEIPLFKKLFSWMPWYRATMVDPLEENGFLLRTSDYIHKVVCPIMIIHAEDDEVTPIVFSSKLIEFAQDRDKNQGASILHRLPASFGYGHYSIYKAPELPDYIMNQTKVCEQFKRFFK